METAEIRQKQHYDEIIAEYERHYDDAYSKRYRDAFIYRRMFGGIDLRNARVLEAMCGSGSTTEYLSSRGAIVTGLDISEVAIKRFAERWPAYTTVCTSIFDSRFPDNTFDYIVIVGGLHHIHPRVTDGLREMTRVLKPGGHLGFAEPHTGSFFDRWRKRWYAKNDLFEANEESINVRALTKEFAGDYDVIRERYIGNIAYLFVFNSMVFRVPAWLKRIYSALFIAIETMLIPLLEKPTTSCMAVCLWRKKPVSDASMPE
jgi:SAM-dependent methyltransferase